jgi:hypothetical protein
VNALASSGLFWFGLIYALAALYITPTLIGIARKVENLALVVILNTMPIAWPAALLAACMMPRKDGR